GKPAHAGGNPWDGVNALDALVSAYNNVAMLRQQIRPEQRIHAAFTKVPQVMNVIPDHTAVTFGTRSPTWADADRLMERVTDCLKAGALATGCRVEYERTDGYLDLRLNRTLCERYTHHMGASYSERIRLMTDEYMSASTDMGCFCHRNDYGCDNTKSREVLGVQFRGLKECVDDTVRSMLDVQAGRQIS
ncbi:Amidohydrolase, partial [Rasamsonia emersonii CBS 393.64]